MYETARPDWIEDIQLQLAGKVDFLRLIEAQRQLIELREEQIETISDYHRYLAELRRVAAVPIEVSNETNR